MNRKNSKNKNIKKVNEWNNYAKNYGMNEQNKLQKPMKVKEFRNEEK
jgi:hypothetical protein